MKSRFLQRPLGRMMTVLLALCAGLALAEAAANTAPTISSIGNQTISEDGNTGALSFTVGDAEDNANQLSVSKSSSNTTLIPTGSVVISGNNANKTVTITPASNKSGSSQIRLIVTDTGGLKATNTFSVTVNAVNDPPVFTTQIGNKNLSEDFGTRNYSFAVSDVDSSTVTKSLVPSTLSFATLSLSGNTLTVSSKSNAYGTNDLRIIANDGSGGISTNKFSLRVASVNDAPTLTGPLSATVKDYAGSTNIFAGLTVADSDSTGNLVMTVNMNNHTIGDIFPAGISSQSVTGSVTFVNNWLRGLGYLPKSNLQSSGTKTKSISLSVSDGQANASKTFNVTVEYLNEPPSMTIYHYDVIDNVASKPFTMVVHDSDPNETFTLRVDMATANATSYGSFPSIHQTGLSAQQVQVVVKDMVFTPLPNVVHASKMMNVRFRLTDSSGGIADVTNAFRLVEASDVPLFSGFNVSAQQPLIYANKKVFSATSISDVDWGGAEPLDVVLTATEGSFNQSSVTNSTDATSWIQNVEYTAPVVAPGIVKTIELQVQVTDAASNVNYVAHFVRIDGSNRAPYIDGIPSNNEVKLQNGVPFPGMRIQDDEDRDLFLTVTVLSDGSIGTLTMDGNTVVGPTQFTGTTNELSSILANAHFVENTNYTWGLNQERIYQVRLETEDRFGDRELKELVIRLDGQRTTYLVTNTNDAGSGSLRDALSKASGGDSVTFALSSYPAVVRLQTPLVVSKACSIYGPGADLLRISGDSNDDGMADIQLFEIASGVEMVGLTLESGVAYAGGACAVSSHGTLSLRSCVIRDCAADEWGGAIDVFEGQLAMENCLVYNNATLASSVGGGGGVSVYSDFPVRLVNCTFSGNRHLGTQGIGGGAVYLEKASSAGIVTADIVHCTFSENSDVAVDDCSSVMVGFGVEMRPVNTIFNAPTGTRNIYSIGGGLVQSRGGNLASDDTYILVPPSGNPGENFLLAHHTDQTSVSAMGLALFNEQVGGYLPELGSPALSAPVSGDVAVDQRGVLRGSMATIGALQYNAESRILINELRTRGTNDFVELYVPRDAAEVNLDGCKLIASGVTNSFSNLLIGAGKGLVVSNGLDLSSQGTIVLVDSNGWLMARADYVDRFESAVVVGADESLTLLPQFRGAALVPHSDVKLLPPPYGSYDTNWPGLSSSSGADAGNTAFGATNAVPVALDDSTVVFEDKVSKIDVLSNEFDADGARNMLVATGLINAPSYIQLDTATNLSMTTGWMELAFDARTTASIQQLSVGETNQVHFQYVLKDYNVESNYWAGGSATGTVDVAVFGANDFPFATAVSSNTTLENSPLTIKGTNLLEQAGTADLDSDGARSLLRVVGVLDQLHAITNIAASANGMAVELTAPGHGLATGEAILISGYGGDPSYNGSQVVTVLDADRFTIPVTYVDAHAQRGVFGRLDDQIRLETTTALGSSVLLDIRVDPNATKVTYDPRFSAVLDALSNGQTTNDFFYFAFEDQHGAVALGTNQVFISGVNDPLFYAPTQDPLQVLLPLSQQAGVSLTDVLTGLSVVDAAPSAVAGRKDVRVLPAGGQDTDSVVLEELWYTDEDSDLFIPATNLLYLVADVDQQDRPEVTGVFTSQRGVMVSLASNTVSYLASGATNLNILSHDERIVDSFDVQISDGKGGVVTNTVAILVQGRNDQPWATDDMGATAEDTLFELDLAINDGDVDTNNVLRVIPFSGVTNGAFYSISNNVFRLDPRTSAHYDALARGQSESLLFDYTLTDQTQVFANEDLFRVAAGSIGVELDILRNDRSFNQNGGTVRVAEVGLPDKGGSVTIATNGLHVVYTPHPYYTGDEVFSYTIQDDTGALSRGRVTIRVTDEVKNASLQANTDLYTATVNEPVGLDVLMNDNRLPATGQVLTIEQLGGTNSQFSATLVNNQILFRAQQVGFYTFNYTVSGGGTARATAQVIVEVVDRNDRLWAQNDVLYVEAGSLNNQLPVVSNDLILPDGVALILDRIEIAPMHGIATKNAALGTVVYTPTNSAATVDQLTYRVTDQMGAFSTATATIYIGNGQETCDDAFAVYHESGVTNVFTLPVLENDAFEQLVGGPVQIYYAGTQGNGSVQITANGAALLYTPNPSYNGMTNYTEVLDYEIGNGTPYRASGQVTVSVLQRAEVIAPDTNEDRFSVQPDSSKNRLKVLANDGALPADASSWTLSEVSTPVQGQAKVNGSEIEYTPNSGFVGTDRFTYVVTDGLGAVSTGDVFVVVGNLLLNEDTFTVISGTTGELDVIANDGVLEGFSHTITLSNAVGSAQGDLVSVTNNKVLFTPDPHYVGNYPYERTVTYYVTHDGGLLAQQAVVHVVDAGSDRDDALLTVAVNGVNDLPGLEGFSAAQYTDDKTDVKLYPTARIVDVDNAGTETQTILLQLANTEAGLLTNLGGLVSVGSGRYSMQGSPAQVTATLTNLVYVPVENRMPGGAVETVDALLLVNDPFMTTVITNELTLQIVSVNDHPVAADASYACNEDEVIRMMGDPTLLGQSIVFNTDANYSVPVRMAPTHLLAGDSDVDIDDTESTLRLMGLVDQVQSITQISGTAGAATTTIHSANHGLVSGQRVVVERCSGHPTYNGEHVVTVLDANRFTIPVSFQGVPVALGRWGRLSDGAPLAGTSAYGAAVVLDLRTDRAETSVIYNPRVSASLNALSVGQQLTDTFFYAVRDAHNAIALGQVNIMVSGVNDTPTTRPDPDAISLLLPHVGTGTIGDLLSQLTSLDSLPDSPIQTDLKIQLNNSSTNLPLQIEQLWVTYENQVLSIDPADLLANDSDVDAGDTLSVVQVFNSLAGVGVALQQGSIIYDAPASSNLNALVQSEQLFDAFSAVVSDQQGGLVTNEVIVLVLGVNDTPLATSTQRTVNEDGAFEINFVQEGIISDADHNGRRPDDQLWVVETNQFTALGAAISITNNVFSYDPSVSTYFNGLSAATAVTDTVSYTVTDQSFLFVNDDFFRVPENGAGFELDVLANDRHENVRTSALSITEVGVPDQQGSVSLNAGRIVYSPAAGFVGDELFTYGVEDGFGNYRLGRVRVRVTEASLNGALQANDDFFTVAVGEQINLPVLDNDGTLPNAMGLRVVRLLQTNGMDQVSLQQGIISYYAGMHQTTYPYTNTFAYVLSGGGSEQVIAEVQVQVLDRRSAVRAEDDHFFVQSNAQLVPLNVVENDRMLTEVEFPAVSQILTAPSHGTASVDQANNRVVYTPNPSFVGEDMLTYEVTDTMGGAGTARVRLTVGIPAIAPADDRFIVYYAGGATPTYTLPVLDNDAQGNGAVGNLKIYGYGIDDSNGTNAPSQQGVVSVASDGRSLTYQPNISYQGTQSYVEYFTYELGDDSTDRTNGYVAVTVLVGADLDLSAQVNDDRFSVQLNSTNNLLNVLSNDGERLPGADQWVVSNVSASQYGGQVQVDPQGLRYTPATGFVGTDQFSYTIEDGRGGTGRASVSVNVGAILLNKDRYTVVSGTTSNALKVLVNDDLLPSAPVPLVLEQVSASQAGATIAVADDRLYYTPSASYSGTYPYVDRFSYGVSNVFDTVVTQSVEVLVMESKSDQSTETISISVQGVNDLPELNGFVDLRELSDKQLIQPYGLAQVVDVDEWGDELQTISLQLNRIDLGSFSNTTAFVDAGNGLLQLTARPAAVSSALNALNFMPVENIVPGGTNEVVTCTVNVSDPFMPTSHVRTLELKVWSENDAPVISGVGASVQTSVRTPVALFPSVTILDVDEQGMQRLTVSVLLDQVNSGAIHGPAGFVEVRPGVYEMSGSPTAVTAALRNLEYAPSSASSNHAILRVSDGFVATPVEVGVDITITEAALRDAWRAQHFGTNTMVSGDFDDPDGDGLSNLSEYAFGTDPNVVNSGSEHAIHIEQIAPGSIRLSYPYRTDDASLTFVLQRSDTVGQWVDADLLIYKRTTIVTGSGFARDTVDVSAAGDTSFYRIIVRY